MLKHLTYIVCLKQSLKLVFNITATLLKEQEKKKKTGKEFPKGSKKTSLYIIVSISLSLAINQPKPATQNQDTKEKKVLSNV